MYAIRSYYDWQGLENWSEKVDVLKQIESYGVDLSFDYEPVSELTIHYSSKAKTITGKNACYLVRRGSSTGCLDTRITSYNVCYTKLLRIALRL